MSSELEADAAPVGASQLTELDADDAPKAADVKDVEAPAVNKSANNKSSLKESIMSHNLERDHVSCCLDFVARRMFCL